MAITFSINSWSGWTLPHSLAEDAPANGIEGSQAPDAALIPQMLRRRLNQQGRIAASQLLRHLAAGDTAPLVYSSRHGDIHRTLDVLKELARNELVSPMNFSLSVHNAIPGILSIHSKLTSNITSLAAGDNGLVPTLLEAIGLLDTDCPRAICLLCDVPLPEIYREQGEGPQIPYALCLVVTSGEGQALTLEFAGLAPANDNHASEELPESLSFADFLGGHSSTFTTRHNGAFWRIARS